MKKRDFSLNHTVVRITLVLWLYAGCLVLPEPNGAWRVFVTAVTAFVRVYFVLRWGYTSTSSPLQGLGFLLHGTDILVGSL